jgi:hypothetical protein
MITGSRTPFNSSVKRSIGGERRERGAKKLEVEKYVFDSRDLIFSSLLTLLYLALYCTAIKLSFNLLQGTSFRPTSTISVFR